MGEHRGGSRFGKIQNSWPFVKLTISDDRVAMRTMLQDVEIKRPYIEAIIIRRSFLNHRFIFIHNDPAIKKEIEFWSFSPQPVADDLRSHGYPVSEESR